MYQLEFNGTDGTFQIRDPLLNEAPRLARQLEDGINLASKPTDPIRFFPKGHARGGRILLRNDYGDGLLINISPSGMVAISDFLSVGDIAVN